MLLTTLSQNPVQFRRTMDQSFEIHANQPEVGLSMGVVSIPQVIPSMMLNGI